MPDCQHCKYAEWDYDDFDFGGHVRHWADGNKKGSTWRYMEEFEQEYPEIAKEYFDGP